MSELERRKRRQNALILRAQAGDEGAMEELLRENHGLILKHARYYANQTGMTELEDLLQCGRLGLVRACRKFDCGRGLAFTTYAVYWIRQMMRRAVDRENLIHIPVHIQTANSAGTYGKELPLAIRCLDLHIIDGDQDRIIDMIPADNDTEAEAIGESEMTIALRQAIATLAPREREVITLLFGMDGGGRRSLNEVGALIGYSREGVRQIKVRALAALKTQLGG